MTRTDNEEVQLGLNDGSLSRLQQGLLVDPETGQCFDPSNGCVPLDIFGAGRLSEEGIEFLRSEPWRDVVSRKQYLASGFVRGKLFEGWAGPVEAVFGGEWRRDDGRYKPDEAFVQDDSLGWELDVPVDGKEEVFEAFSELLLPLAQSKRFADYLALGAGYRYSKYDHAGSVDTYKLGLQWQPVGGLRFRGMFQRAVRAPNLREAFEEQQIHDGFFVSDDPRDDPCSASSDPVGDVNVEKCIATGLPADQIGVFEARPFSPHNSSRVVTPPLAPKLPTP